MVKSRKAILGLACLWGAVAMMLLPTGCDLFSLGGGTGTLEMLITDAPFPFSLVTEASVTITRIEVRQDASDDGDSENGNEISDDGGDGDNENDNGDDGGADDGGNDNANDNGDAGPAQETDDGNENDNENDNANENENGNANDNGDDSDDDTDDEAGEDDSDESESAFVTILDEEVTFDLLDLQNGATAPLASASLTASSYSQIRFIVSSGHVVLADGREFELTVPSGEQTGIKLTFDFTITGDETTTLLLDVDVSKAFVPIPGGDVNDASQIESFLFKPSLALRITELESTGTASGEVVDESDAPLAGVAVSAFLGDVGVTTTATAEDGSYVLNGLESGTYSVVYSLAGFTSETVFDVEVTAGANTAVDPVVLAAAP
ncbi:MAG: DUF4382 domain-containing protein [Planctomycetes bacterium]|nr:DUF4382 domain-containing protein [Planctomycetota bacterium]